METEINGFKIVRRFQIEGKGRFYCVATCKVCGNEWTVRLSSLKLNSSCGCVTLFKPLPDRINGFKIIKDLGISKGGTRKAIIECEICHRHYEVQAYYIKKRKPCECLRPKRVGLSDRKSHRRLDSIYRGMKDRCYNKNHQDYYNYGEKGIQVCDEWLNTPDAFCKWALENGYTDKLTIDRIDGSNGYSPENCRWATATEQSRNRKGIKLTMEKARAIRAENTSQIKARDIAKKYGVARQTVVAVLSNKIWKE